MCLYRQTGLSRRGSRGEVGWGGEARQGVMLGGLGLSCAGRVVSAFVVSQLLANPAIATGYVGVTTTE